MVDPESAAAAVKAAVEGAAADRAAATAFLDSIKSGDVRVLGGTAFALTSQNHALEVRHYGLKLLQHIVRIRWDELNQEEKRNMTGMVLDMVKEFSTSHEAWSFKSQTAALVAEVTRRETGDVWNGILQSLLSLSDMSPVHAEMVAMVLRWLPEDVIIHNEDLETTRRRQLLSQLTDSLAQLLPFLYKLIEKHFGAAREASQLSQLELAKQHAAVVTAGLNAVLVYAEWSPVTNFSNYGLIEACGFLINSNDFRLISCEILKQLLSRRKPTEGIDQFNSVLARVYEVLSSVCDAYFVHCDGGGHVSLEFAECLCEALVALGCQNLQVISCNDEKLAIYYRQMLKFLQHSDFSFHALALPLWLGLLRESVNVERNKMTVPVSKATITIPMETASTLLDVVFQKLLKDVHEEFTSALEYGMYRSRLVELTRLVTYHYHEMGIRKVVQRFDVFLAREKIPPQEYSILGNMHIMLDAAVTGSSEHGGTSDALDGLLQRLLNVRWSDPELVEIHAKCLDALVPYIKTLPPAVPLVIEKLFQLLMTVPMETKEASVTNSKARFQVCTSFLRIAKLAGPALLPHMQIIAETMTKLQQERHLHRGEYILLGESLLVGASAGGAEQQNEVLEWLLGPFREYWVHSDWQQNYLCDPAGLVRLLETADGEKSSEGQRMWYIFHSIHFFEKALRRCGAEGNSNASHPMASHMHWILPPLIQLLRCLHSLWMPSIRSSLPQSLRQAIHLSASEQATMLGETTLKPLDGKEDEQRGWLKGVRDSGYNVLRYASSRLGHEFFVNMSGLSAPIATGLLESLSFMEFRHLRSLIHTVIQSFVRFCPTPLREAWLGQLLPPLLVHCDETLPIAWENLAREGAAKTGTLFLVDGCSGIKTEVLEERILRELTREVCSLLGLMASHELNSGQQSGMLWFIMQHPSAAVATVHLGIKSLQWPDGDAVHKSVVFCGAVTNLAGTTDDSNLREVVGKDMFTTIIHSLTLESNVSAHAELLGLLREIYMTLTPYTSTPKQILMSLPSISLQEFSNFEAALKKTTSVKEQRQHIRNLLLAAGGDQLRALKPQKNTGVITNLTGPVAKEKPAVKEEDGQGLVGLATIL